MGSMYSYDRSRIKKVAEEYRENCGEIPVDTDALSLVVEGYVGRPIKKRYVKFSRPEIEAKESHFLVSLSELRSSKQERTDHAHELAHALHTFDWAPIGKVPNMRVNYQGCWPVRKREEIICDEIALYLACPPWAIESFIDNYFRNYQLRLFRTPEASECLRLMAEHFQIPREELEVHLKALFESEKLWQVLQAEKRRIWKQTFQPTHQKG